MLRIKIRKASSPHRRCEPGRCRVAIFTRLLSRHDTPEHPVSLRAAQRRRRGDARACERGFDDARSVRQLGEKHHWMPVRGNASETEIFDVDAMRRGDDALLPSPAIGRPAEEVQDRVRRVALKITRSHRFTTSRLARTHRRWQERGSVSPSRAARPIMPVSRLRALRLPPVEEMFNVAEAVVACLPPLRRLSASATEPDEVRREAAWLGRLPRAFRGVPRRGSRRKAARVSRSILPAPGRRLRPTGLLQKRRHSRPSPRWRAHR